MSPAAAAALFGALATAALLAEHTLSTAVIAAILLAVCLTAPVTRRRFYLAGVAVTSAAIFLLSPLVASLGGDVLWAGPSIPVLGTLDVTTDEIAAAGAQALRFAALGLAFVAYALLLDHDRLVQSAGFARRSVFAVALATRLVPTLERDAAGLIEALRGRGVEVRGIRGRARLLSPLVGGSLERALSLAESMEARGYGRPGRTRPPTPPWRFRDRAAVTAALLLLPVGWLWL